MTGPVGVSPDRPERRNDLRATEYWVCLGDEWYAGPFPDYLEAHLERKHIESRSGISRYAGYRIRTRRLPVGEENSHE